MLRAYFGCFGSGLGHATRMLEVADLVCREGGEVRFSSSDEVAQLIQGRGYTCNRLPLADVSYADDGAFSLRKTMIASPVILARTYRQVYLEARNIARFGPNVVLSDSSLPTLLAAKFAGLPAFAILNQLILSSSHERTNAAIRLLSVGTSAGVGRLWELSDEVLLPDLPPPLTISERNLWGSKVGKTRYIGFLQMSKTTKPDAVSDKFAADPRKKIFWQVSGPPSTRRPLVEQALKIAASLADEYVFAVSAGDPLGTPEPSVIPGGWYYGWCRTPEIYFSQSDVIVSRAGHGTIGQAIMASKPSLLIPIPRQPEQEGNALKAQRLRIARKLNQDDLSLATARESFESLLATETVSRVSSIGKYASGFKAAEEVVRTLKGAAG